MAGPDRIETLKARRKRDRRAALRFVTVWLIGSMFMVFWTLTIGNGLCWIFGVPYLTGGQIGIATMAVTFGLAWHHFIVETFGKKDDHGSAD